MNKGTFAEGLARKNVGEWSGSQRIECEGMSAYTCSFVG